MSHTVDVVRDAVTDTYGDSPMSRALIRHLAERIDTFQGDDEAYYGDRQREDMIRNVCWNFFSGGTTAASVARKIEERLNGGSDR